MSGRIWRNLRYARQQSFKSDYYHKVGAIVCQGAIVKARGFNQLRNAGIGRCFTEYQESLHAERHACMQLQREEIKGCDIYLWRETKDQRPALSKPCDKCREMLRNLGIKRAIYSIQEFPYYNIERL